MLIHLVKGSGKSAAAVKWHHMSKPGSGYLLYLCCFMLPFR